MTKLAYFDFSECPQSWQRIKAYKNKTVKMEKAKRTITNVDFRKTKGVNLNLGSITKHDFEFEQF